MDIQTDLANGNHLEHIQGLVYIENFIMGEQAERLVEEIDNNPWDTGLKRRVQHYGWRYDYKARRVDNTFFLGPLPPWLHTISQTLATNGIFERVPNQVIVNEYLPGQGISAHIDCLPCFGPTIASLSLGSQCIMRLSRHPMKIDKRLAAQSLLVLSGEARKAWQHEIPARKFDLLNGQRQARTRRLSLTFRTINIGKEKTF